MNHSHYAAVRNADQLGDAAGAGRRHHIEKIVRAGPALYTTGLIESRREATDNGMAGLRCALVNPVGDLNAPCDVITAPVSSSSAGGDAKEETHRPHRG
ncbi:hypothetical protein [Streptomyces sp. KR55]|uniref:hypothetical protein n=1 Tax=Streptomyces sp. KR55 TaxID=3457425 RepID=UPI003FD498FE